MSAHSFRNSRNELSFSTALASPVDFDFALASPGDEAAGAGVVALFFDGGGGGGWSSSSSSSSMLSSLMKSSSSIILRAAAAFVDFLPLPPRHDRNYPCLLTPVLTIKKDCLLKCWAVNKRYIIWSWTCHVVRVHSIAKQIKSQKYDVSLSSNILSIQIMLSYYQFNTTKSVKIQCICSFLATLRYINALNNNNNN